MMEQKEYLLRVLDLKKYFPIRRGILGRVNGYVRAVEDVSLEIRRGETFSLVGESGCGKSTVGRSILRLIDPSGGRILFRSEKLAPDGKDFIEVDVALLSRRRIKALRREMQIIYQDPYSSLNPRMTVGDILSEPLIVHGEDSSRQSKVRDLLEAVGLKHEHINRYPHEFSGGQRQRIGIARALALRPKLIVADEPVSALDVSVRAQVLNLMEDLQEEFGLTYLFIAHDLSVVRHISTRVGVMYLGRIMEAAEKEELFGKPRHPYTEALMSAVPVPNPDLNVCRIRLKGEVGNPSDPPTGCVFHPRCPYCEPICAAEIPVYRDLGGEHFCACHLAERLALRPVCAPEEPPSRQRV